MSAFVTHAVFPLESWKRFTQVPSFLISRWRRGLTQIVAPLATQPKEGEQPFHHFYTTNSCPETAETIQGKKPFEVLSLAQSISNNVFKY